jgi:hypothetical protein
LAFDKEPKCQIAQFGPIGVGFPRACLTCKFNLVNLRLCEARFQAEGWED